ncbi:hypothetical protein KP509_08G036500 [Ceratopteris richardii]|uniref:Uncharacterized protein n=1 Tax=Ceratopteris richardii TaxID=49495 RepID=A0A8T2UBN2_CERRI|nr:hypothetical protein KP509_08G036500 [Ceratopteris richardii]
MLVDPCWLESLTLARNLSQHFGAITLCQGMWLGVFSSLLLMPPYVASIASAKGASASLTPQVGRSSRSHICPSEKNTSLDDLNSMDGAMCSQYEQSDFAPSSVCTSCWHVQVLLCFV